MSTDKGSQMSTDGLSVPICESAPFNRQSAPICASNKGASLITVIIVLTFIASLGASQIAVVMSRLNKINLEADRLKAYYLAEAAFAVCQHEMGTGFDEAGDGIGTIPFRHLGQGVYTAVHDYGNKTINATGIVNDVKRSIFVKYDTM